LSFKDRIRLEHSTFEMMEKAFAEKRKLSLAFILYLCFPIDRRLINRSLKVCLD